MLRPSPASRTEFVELLHDRSTIIRTLVDLVARSGSVRCVLTSSGGVDGDLLDLVVGAAERGRLLLDAALALRTESVDRATRHRVEVRVHSGPARPMLVFDDRSAVLPLATGDLNAGAVLLRSPLSDPYGQLFELMWSDARTPAECAPHDHTLTSREVLVIGLLLDGATDHQVAARLGMSSRTVRAVVAQLQQRFGTRSRMALGFRLARVTD
ncbi:helix-turn-helix transcriptional regulator [Nocardia sp. NRRL S-836]|uniref:helix-turn-helix transcriptional regulator n=1 Tax=Nocardia sp. NRRL S-836 TaxID=1519492 RepID=UPI0006B02AA2|nr:helix-turn-helix transcriptional regulator [Nocardia sp. NRRL S-836]